VSGRRAAGLLLAALAALTAAAPAQAAQTTQNQRFTASDGVTLATTLSGEAPIKARPTIVEFSPYGRGSGTLDPGPDFNFLLVQIRGTGDSNGQFDALGNRTQKDVAEVLRWACDQPWSNGKLGLNGFSASAITIYNSLHRKLPCVRAAVMKSGTYELYRDLLWPGGVSNFIPGAGVLALIGTPAAVQGIDRLISDPGSAADILAGLAESGLNGGLLHPTLDSWWRERGFRGDVNHLPILMIDGFYDVESRGAFQAFQRLRRDGAHLVVIGAHDGAPQGTDGGVGESRAWLEHFVRGVPNGVTHHPRAQLWLAKGDREDLLDGQFKRFNAHNWPVPGTRWKSLRLDPATSGTADSLNDGTLRLGRPGPSAEQSYPAAATLPSATDPYNTAIIGSDGPNQISAIYPPVTELGDAEAQSLTYTMKPFARRVLAAGPVSLNLRLSSSASQTAIWAVLADVWPDGSAHPVAAGRLLSDYPKVIRKRSLRRRGRIVQPYDDFTHPDPATPGKARLYRIEIWPIGNSFARGHRLRLYILGTSAASKPGEPALNTVRIGAKSRSKLVFPVLPGSHLPAALR
jgi:predicted acyl esterase